MQRVDLLWAGIQRRQKHTLASVVGAMNGAATQDLRLVRVWPVVRDVLARGTGTPRATRPRPRSSTRGTRPAASRLDADLDGKVDAPGAAVLDAAWGRIANAVLAPVLDDRAARAELAKLVPNDPPLAPDGSSAYSGWWSYVQKDLRALLGRPVAGSRSRRGSAAPATWRACAASLWAALDEAAARARGGAGARPGRLARGRDGRADPVRARDPHRTMRGSNKPTFQQAITFSTHR